MPRIKKQLERAVIYGGWGEIRTHGGVAPTPVFKTGAFNRSATPPLSVALNGMKFF